MKLKFTKDCPAAWRAILILAFQPNRGGTAELLGDRGGTPLSDRINGGRGTPVLNEGTVIAHLYIVVPPKSGESRPVKEALLCV